MNGIAEVAGLERFRFAEFIRRGLRARKLAKRFAISVEW